jgi:nitroreductase/NAD-dependent dihydropyrimidine dehydrogenase PreA subunit
MEEFMTLFSVDPDKCNRDGICATVCPFALIEMKSEDAVPTPVDIAGERCMNCGHCMAACPTGALSLNTMAPSDCIPISLKTKLDKVQMDHLLLARRSIRVFKDKPVPRETVEELLRMASYAPTGHNSQMTQWLVIDDPDHIRHLAGMVIDWLRGLLDENPGFARSMEADILVAQWDKGNDYILRSAPCLVIAHAPEHFKGIHLVRNQFVIAMTYLELAAMSMGLGGCWGGFFQAAVEMHPPMNAAIGLPEGHLSYECMVLGYPKYPYHRIPKRNEPKVNWR